MRMLKAAAAGAALLAGLTACQSEESYRAEFRSLAVSNCRAGDPAAKAQLTRMGVDIDRMCTCVIDRYMRSATYEQLKQDYNHPAPPGALAQFGPCTAELSIVRGASGGRSVPMAPGAADAARDAARSAAEADRALDAATARMENAIVE